MKDIEDRLAASVYHKFPVVIVRGKDSTLWDINGKEYIDCMGGYGVAIVGHCNTEITKALYDQSKKLITCHGSIYNDTRSRFLEKMIKIAPKELERAYLCNSGTESVECALKLARKYSGKTEIIAMVGSYHGKTFGSLSVTWEQKYRQPFLPLLPDVKFATFGDIDKIKRSITARTAAIIVEPVQGEIGIRVAPEGFLRELREICNENNILLIFDEIQSGLGRTGRMWACEHWNVTPDIMCIAKGIAGGLPLGVTLAKSDVMSAFKVGDQTSTFGGNPLSCAAGCATIDYILDKNLVGHADRLGKVFKEKLERIKEEHQIVRDVRGLGLMLAMELRFDVRNILLRGIEMNLMMLYSGKNILRFLPPLVINEDQLQKAGNILEILVSEEEKIRL